MKRDVVAGKRMLVRHIMTRGVRCVHDDDSISSAARAMQAAGVGFLPVRSEGRVVGVVTDRDLALRPATRALPPSTTRVREIMTPHAHAVEEGASIATAARAMVQKQVRHLLVLDRRNRLCGVVTLGDLGRRANDPSYAAAVLRRAVPRDESPTLVPSR